ISTLAIFAGRCRAVCGASDLARRNGGESLRRGVHVSEVRLRQVQMGCACAQIPAPLVGPPVGGGILRPDKNNQVRSKANKQRSTTESCRAFASLAAVPHPRHRESSG